MPSPQQVAYWKSPEGKSASEENNRRRKARLMRTLTRLIEHAEKEIAEHGKISRNTRYLFVENVVHIHEKTPDALVIERAKKRVAQLVKAALTR